MPKFEPRVAAIIQARVGSKRLPGKVLKPIGPKTMLQWVIDRTWLAQGVDCIVVATPDKRIADFVDSTYNNVPIWSYWHRSGDEDDVLTRYLHASNFCGAEVIIRITADCPLIDPEIIESAMSAIGSHDICSNVQYRTFPKGTDVEVMQYDTLLRLNRLTDSGREHVTTFIYENPGLFDHEVILQKDDVSFMDWSVDTQTDLDRVRMMYKLFNWEVVSHKELTESLLNNGLRNTFISERTE